MKSRQFAGWAIALLLLLGNTSQGAMVVTEWMYQGSQAGGEDDPAYEAGEFVELTNVGDEPIDMTGWSFDDDSQEPGVFDLSEFGVVQPGESVVFTDWNAQLFKNSWGLGDDVKVIGFSSPGLGRRDEVNLFDSSDVLVDRFTYGDGDLEDGHFPDTLRTQAFSGNIPPAALGMNDVYAAVASEAGDAFGSYESARGEWGNPGFYPATTTAVPEPASVVLAVLGSALVMWSSRRYSRG